MSKFFIILTLVLILTGCAHHDELMPWIPKNGTFAFYGQFNSFQGFPKTLIERR